MSEAQLTPREVKRDVELAKKRAADKAGLRTRTNEQLPNIFGPIAQDLGQASVAVALLFLSMRMLTWMFLIAGFITAFQLPVIETFREHIAPDSSVWMKLAVGSWQDWVDPAKHTYVTTVEPPLWGEPLTPNMTVDELEEYFADHVVLPNALIMMMFTFFLIYLYRRVRTASEDIDKAVISTGDYAVEVLGIPMEHADRKELMDYFRKQGRGKVIQVELAYECEKYVDMREEWNKLIIDYKEVRAAYLTKTAPSKSDQTKLDDKRSELEAIEKELKAMQGPGKKPTGVAYVIYDTEASRNKCMQVHNPSILWVIIDFFFGWIPCCRCARPRYHGVALKVDSAPEPGDVYWRNLHVPRSRVRYLAVRTFALAVLLILASFLCLIALESLSNWVGDKGQELVEGEAQGDSSADKPFKNSPMTWSDLVGQILDFAAGLVINVFDGWIASIIVSLTEGELRYTRTDFEESLYVKTALAVILNSTVLLFFVHLASAPDDEKAMTFWYENGGVMNKAFFTIVINALVPSIQMALKPEDLVNRYFKARYAKSQAKLDQLWEPAEFEVTETFIEVTKTVALALVFAPVMPIVWWISAFALATKYVFGRYAIARVKQNPPALGAGLSLRFGAYFNLIVFLSLLSQFWYYGLEQSGGERDTTSAGSWLIFALTIFLMVALVPKNMVPYLNPYFAKEKDLDENDTGGKRWSAEPGLDRYTCPIVETVPTYVDDDEKLRGSTFNQKAGAPPAKGTKAAKTGTTPRSHESAGTYDEGQVAEEQPAQGGRVCLPCGVRRKRNQEML